jgi:hypothetical protein
LSTRKRIVLVSMIIDIMAYDITDRFSHLNRVLIGFARGGGGGDLSLLIYFFGFFSLSSIMLGSNRINPDFF